ncbi:uncharacterized protein EV420DRAFT_538467 [Desarmillaria tabescens]|uniref:F-box domain-containing protein n=1 Tax=Armillaria tabescens TaxID=1929756 RepID=A0AA39N4G3_ARMTA|nr:uncharacterized protein EV420DRAFT_538467 [Desarmillaria tabescens]KAK0457069.1 hypothetical protein EV420DRAFT_538467 [Desarmillaria tabescens]
MLANPIFTRDNGDTTHSICRANENFWHVLLCIGSLGAVIGAFFALIRIVLLSSLIPSCILLYRRVSAGYASYCQGSKENLPIIIDFCRYFCILHPVRRLRVYWRSHICARFRDREVVNVPRDCVLPQELCEVIIHFCHSDRETLLACSLVCRAWVPSSRSLLWTRVHSGDHVREFVKLLQSPENTISPYIQSIWLEMYTKWDRLIRYQHALRALANADAILIRAIITGQSLDPVRALHCHFPHIKRLSFNYEDLGDNEATSAANFRRLLWYSSLFCHLERLSIRFLNPGGTDIPLSSLEECKLPMHLRSLSLKCWNRDLLCWLESRHKTLRLTTFKLKIENYACTLDPSPINGILRACYTSLRSVTFTVVEWENGVNIIF